MDYAPLSNDVKTFPPPPYQPNETTNFGMQSQPQELPYPGQPPYTISQPPPPPGFLYSQPSASVTMYPSPSPTTMVQPLGGFLSHHPQATQCPSCRQQIVTQVQYEAGGMTWLIAFLICFFGGFIGCCLIPFCVPSCQDAIHTCPACHSPIGRRSPF